ncbi:LSD1-like 3 [Wolffia australiana]
MEEPVRALEEMEGEGTPPAPLPYGRSLPVSDVGCAVQVVGRESDDDKPIRTLVKSKRRKLPKKDFSLPSDNEALLNLGKEETEVDMKDTLASLKQKLNTSQSGKMAPKVKKKSSRLHSKKGAGDKSTASYEDPESPSDGFDLSLSEFLSNARKLSSARRKPAEEALGSADGCKSSLMEKTLDLKDELSLVSDGTDNEFARKKRRKKSPRGSDEVSRECSGIISSDIKQKSKGFVPKTKSSLSIQNTGNRAEDDSSNATVNPAEKNQKLDDPKRCSEEKIVESTSHVSRKVKRQPSLEKERIEPLESNPSPSKKSYGGGDNSVRLHTSSANMKTDRKTSSSDGDATCHSTHDTDGGVEAPLDGKQSSGHVSREEENVLDSFSNGAISEMDNRVLDKPKAQPRVSRKIKRIKDSNMTYEGDYEWEALMYNDQGFFGNPTTADEERSARERNRVNSVMPMNSGEGGLAAVAAGLKSHDASPIEKVKFKEILKRKGGLRDYLECRNMILNLWSKNVNCILTLGDCGLTDLPLEDEPPRTSLLRQIFTFLDRSGYINGGVASNNANQSLCGSCCGHPLKDGSMETGEGQAMDSRREVLSFDLASYPDEKSIEEKVFHGDDDIPTQDSDPFNMELTMPISETSLSPKIQYDCLDKMSDFPASVMHESLDRIATIKLSPGHNEQSCKPQDKGVFCENVDNSVPAQCVNLNSDGNLCAVEANEMVKMNVKEDLVGLGSLTDDVCVKPVDHGDMPSIECLDPSVEVLPPLVQHLDVKSSPESDSKMSGKRIIVVGAGPAGIAAAQHLQRHGVSVTVLEARDRIGGRVYTDRSSLSVPVDLGASIITGVEPDLAAERPADPSSLICTQLGLELTVLNSDCPLYDVVTGGKVPSDLDEALEVEYNSLLDDMVDLTAEDEMGSASMSLEEGLENALRKRHLMGKQAFSGSTCGESSVKKHAAEDEDGAADVLNPLERRVMNWHFANLEYGCAALLKNVSLPHWNQDDVYGGFGGAHCMIKGGYSSVVETLGEGIPIHLKHIVKEIKYETGAPVKVITSDGLEFTGDAALITVPLGCLKAESIEFSPALPEWKQSSINRLGFGVLNKIVLEFPTVFWDDTVDYFGATAEETSERGRCFMFWNVKKTVGAPVLIALVVGKAALDGQDVSKSEHVNHAMLVLRQIFGNDSVPEPLGAVVTNWGRDPYSRGAYSYVAVGASGEDYDVLARPVENRLFFAGEATSKEHPDTVGGAMLSGLREAVRIMDIFYAGYDYTAEVEAMEMAERQEESERDEVCELERKLDLCRVSCNLMLPSNETLLKDLFCNAKTIPGRLHLVKEFLRLPVHKLKSIVGTREALTILNNWILDSLGKDATQLLRHCIRLLVLVSTDLLAVRLSGIGKTVKEKVCMHTSRDIRAIASQLVNVWVEVFRERKTKSLTQQGGTDALRTKFRDIATSIRRTNSKDNGPGCISISDKKGEISADNKLEDNLKEEKISRTLAAAEAARAAKAARMAAEAYTSSEADSTTLSGLPKILSFHRFIRREHIDGSGILGAECISEMDSRNCRVQNWSVDFSAACADMEDSRFSSDSRHIQKNGLSNEANEGADSKLGRASWVDTESLGSGGVKDSLAIERWQSQSVVAEAEMKDDLSNKISNGSARENTEPPAAAQCSAALPLKSNSSAEGKQRGVNHIKRGVVDYAGSLLMPLYKARKIDKDGYKSIMKKTATKVVEQCTESEKLMTADEFLDFKRKNKIRAFVDKLIERHKSINQSSS